MKEFKLKKLKDLRKSKGLSQRDMADLMDMPSNYVYHRKETGKQELTVNELQFLIEYFDVNHEYFFEDKIAKNAKTSA